MRNISFALTTEQFKNRTKTVTRRLGWRRLNVGDRLMGCVKCMGLKPWEKLERLGEIVVLGVRREPLARMILEPCAYGLADVCAEGFPEMSPTEFVEMFCRHMKCTPETFVTRIEFEYI